jgi:hypothetical protein
MADDTRMTQMQRDLYAMQKQVGDLAEIKKQMETLTATMNALLQEKSMRSENEDRRQYHEYHEGESSGGGRPYQNLFNKMDFPRFDGDNPANWLYKATQYFDFNQTQGMDRILITSFHIEGEALIWFQDAEFSGLVNT